MGDPPSGFYVSDRWPVPGGKTADQVATGKAAGGSEVVKVDVGKLRSYASSWHDQSSTWTAIAGKITGLPLTDSYSLIVPYTTGYNSATSKLATFSAAAPAELEKTSTELTDSANAYESTDHDGAQSIANGVTMNDAGQEYSRFGPSGKGSTTPSAGLDSKISQFGKDMDSWSKANPDSTQALANSLNTLQSSSKTTIDLNPLDGKALANSSPSTSTEFGRMSAEHKLQFDLIQKAMEGKTNWGGGELAGKISGSIGVNAKGEFVVNTDGLKASIGAFAGAEASATGTATDILPGITVTGKAGVTAGPGAKVGVKFGKGDDGKFHLGTDNKISPLLGVSAGADIAVDMGTITGKGGGVTTEKRWTTTGEQIDSQGRALDELLCGPLPIAVEKGANSESAKKRGKEAAFRAAGNSVIAALADFGRTYTIVRDAKDFPGKSDSRIGDWDTVARDSGASSNEMPKLRSAGKWEGVAAGMYDNLVARHANAAYDVSAASSFMCDSLAKVATAMNTLFGVAVATGKIAEAKAKDAKVQCEALASSSDNGKGKSVVDFYISQLQKIEGEVKKNTSTLAMAVSAFEQLAAKYGSLVSSVASNVGSDTGGGWPAA